MQGWAHADLPQPAQHAAAIYPPTPPGFASALEMQLEALQDRLHYAQLPRAASAPGHLPGAGAAAVAEAAQLRSELAAAQAQNRTLRATAARLSKALAAVMHKTQAAPGGGGKDGCARGVGAARGGGAPAAAAAEVLQQLTAVESILADM